MESTMQGVEKIDDSPLLSNQQTVSHGPDKFVLDFKCAFSQHTLDNQPKMVILHKAILLDPFTAKSFLKALTENVARYEKAFGPIQEPKSHAVAQKKVKAAKKAASVGTEKPTYMG